ncbi:MAG: hypothetical protein JXQ72_11995 [Anaerolineae bacterium]|nr:hypothetical protein [Anaerolineae bacterium]
MSAVSLDQVVYLANQLSPAERQLLIQRLQPAPPDVYVTRHLLLAELEQLRADGAFEHVESLRNRYADPELALTDAELRASIDEFSNAWEQDIDGLAGDD